MYNDANENKLNMIPAISTLYVFTIYMHQLYIYSSEFNINLYYFTIRLWRKNYMEMKCCMCVYKIHYIVYTYTQNFINKINAKKKIHNCFANCVYIQFCNKMVIYLLFSSIIYCILVIIFII